MHTRVICINDQNRPKEIPLQKWIVKDSEYHITHIFYHPKQKIQGVEISEIFLDDSCTPYQSFRLDRFAVKSEDLNLFLALLRDCTELNDIEIESLIEEIQLETCE